VSTTHDPLVVGPAEGRQFPAARPSVTVKGDAPNSSVAVFESAPPPGVIPAPPHRHHEYTEGFYVLAGEIEFRVGERTLRGEAGTAGGSARLP
jgi:quercetin dioxygenase-like cupin family protein